MYENGFPIKELGNDIVHKLRNDIVVNLQEPHPVFDVTRVFY